MTDIAIRANGGIAQLGYFTTSNKRNRDVTEARRTHF